MRRMIQSVAVLTRREAMANSMKGIFAVHIQARSTLREILWVFDSLRGASCMRSSQGSRSITARKNHAFISRTA